MKQRDSQILKIALFATGLSGIVAEYILATLASYFIGDSVRQWTLLISLMLFCMGLGSRLTRSISGNLFTYFIRIEFLLSIIVGFSALITYSMAAISSYVGIFIYGLATITGLLIGMELPLAIRLNEEFEELQFNVSGILEKDYYGSLLGGLFFAFVGLPYLGLSYTPFVLAALNLGVAILLLYTFSLNHVIPKQPQLWLFALLTALFLFLGAMSTEKIILFGEQKKYKDKIVLSEQSRYQKIVLTQWKDDYWLYLNGNLQFSTYDEALYHEVLVHPAAQLVSSARNILVLGGGDGCAVRELLKYPNKSTITLVDLDATITDLAQQHPVFTKINKNALQASNVEVVNMDAYQFLEQTKQFYNLIIIDLPDPRSIELSRLYSFEFYQLCKKRLGQQGILITQASSPYFSPSAFHCIEKTMNTAGFTTLGLHNQVITMGEWGWVLGSSFHKNKQHLKTDVLQLQFDSISTHWLNKEALPLITSFGKDFFAAKKRDTIRINRIHEPVLYRYYLDSKWDVY